MAVIPIEEIRSFFPALERIYNDKPVAYFDGPGGTQVPRQVVEAVADYLYNHNANTHWGYPTSDETDEIILNARRAFADFLNCSSSEIVFGANMTTLNFHLSRTLGRRFSPGDEIVVTELDHHANVDPWLQMARDFNLEVKIVRMLPETGELDWQHFESCINSKTKLIAVGAASNALGTVSDVRHAVKLARQVGALTAVDAVHYSPHQLPDVRALDCDFFMCSVYKFYGPHVGVLFCKKDLLTALDFPKLKPSSNEAPERAETGTLNHEGIAGSAEAVNFLASFATGETRRQRLETSMHELHENGKVLFKQLWEGLADLPKVKLFGLPPAKERTPTICFEVQGLTSEQVTQKLSEQAIFASHGDYYATTVMERLGYAEHGLVRAGCACYTTSEEIERLVSAVAAL